MFSYRKLLCPSGLSLWFECGSSLLHLADPIIILSFLSLSFIRSFYYIICTIKFSNITHFYFFCSNNSKKKNNKNFRRKREKKKSFGFFFENFNTKKKITSIQREKKIVKREEQTPKKKKVKYSSRISKYRMMEGDGYHKKRKKRGVKVW